MIDYDSLFSMSPFCLQQREKQQRYDEWMALLSEQHRTQCAPYARICSLLCESSPTLPVRLFKDYNLRSVSPDKVIKTMTSSGTSGQAVSKIFLDRDTSARQSKALVSIVSDFVGTKRLPMLIIDSPAVLKDRNMFSARGAGILGFSMLGRDATYALDEQMQLDWLAIDRFFEKHANERILLFGFTFMIWQYFVKALERSDKTIAMNGIMIHGGGWKKLQQQAVSNESFKQAIKKVCGIDTVLNYYGMVEQTGSIFMECPHGHLHASIFSDVIIRDPVDLSERLNGRGLIECRSILPTSYPGHILLTEDEGELLGEDDCPCGRKGRYFKIHGRIQGAEVRGCSDTYERN